MAPEKTNLYFDLDNGRLQELSPGNELHYAGYSASNSSDSPAALSDYTSDLEFASNAPGNFYGCLTKNQCSQEINDMLKREYCPSESLDSRSPLSMYGGEALINIGTCPKEAYLVLRTPPEQRFRYRYDTEMSGTHGSLQGVKSGMEKSVPEIELVNYPSEALIRVSLMTCNEIGERYPHPHNLFIKEKMYQKKLYETLHTKTLTKTGHYSDPHYIRVGMNGNDYVARFEGMCIISSKKENFSASIKEKLQMRDMEQGIRRFEKRDFSQKVEEAVKLVDLDFVSLCFEAFREEGGYLKPICPPLYSEPIGNSKSANTGKLKISRINKCSGSCKGGDEVWLLVEKINKKGLIIKFFEELDGHMLWESCIEGDDIILHHQYAIIFKTPPYRDPNITSEVKVWMRLERSTPVPQACNYSESITFVYEPMVNRNCKNDSVFKKECILSPGKQAMSKRPRTDASPVQPVSFQYKRKRDEQDCASLCFDEAALADLDRIFADNGIEPAELNQFLPKFNVEDFLQFFSDDIDIPLQKDGVVPSMKTRKDLIHLRQLICSRLDGNEIKKITDQMNNIRFSKVKTKPESNSSSDDDEDDNNENDKKDVEEAVSTLLSLRERVVEINNCGEEAKKRDCDNIFEAVIQNKPEVVRRLLKVGVCLNKDEDGNTPLHCSLLLRHDSCTDGILHAWRDLRKAINFKNKEGKTALHIAAANGNLSHVKLLLDCGARVNETETETKRNALHVAIVNKNREVAEFLVENTDIRLDALDADGQTPASIVQLLMQPEKEFFEDLFRPKAVKRETESECKDDSKDGGNTNLGKLFETLNETGSWRILAEMWNCPYIISYAEDAENPSKCVFNCSQEVNGELDLEVLRSLLDVINEKKGLVVLDEILARKFL